MKSDTTLKVNIPNGDYCNSKECGFCPLLDWAQLNPICDGDIISKVPYCKKYGNSLAVTIFDTINYSVNKSNDCKCDSATSNDGTRSEFESAVQPINEFMKKWCCPHYTVIVELDHAELKNGEMSCVFEMED